MPRHNRRRAPKPLHAPAGSAQRVDSWRGEDYAVRPVTGAAATKPYRCPGCDQTLAVGRPHLVTWPLDDLDAADRRHWHTACWAARDARDAGVQRGRGAPRCCPAGCSVVVALTGSPIAAAAAGCSVAAAAAGCSVAAAAAGCSVAAAAACC